MLEVSNLLKSLPSCPLSRTVTQLAGWLYRSGSGGPVKTLCNHRHHQPPEYDIKRHVLKQDFLNEVLKSDYSERVTPRFIHFTCSISILSAQKYLKRQIKILQGLVSLSTYL